MIGKFINFVVNYTIIYIIMHNKSEIFKNIIFNFCLSEIDV